MTPPEIVIAIGALKGRLSGQLTDQDSLDGWTDGNRKDVFGYFENVERDLRSGVRISFFSLVRALDGMGISKGDLLEEACRINNAINALTNYANSEN